MGSLKPAFISLEPEDRIRFEGNYLKEIDTVLKITNKTNTNQCVKVKCTNNDMFRIRPVITIIEAGSTVPVRLTYLPIGRAPDPANHHIGVYHIPAPEGCSPSGVWDEHYGPPQGQYRLKVCFEDKQLK